jgi:hypothetical protein
MVVAGATVRLGRRRVEKPPELQPPAIAANKCIRCDGASIAAIISNQSAETRASASPVVVIAGISIGIA